MQINIENSPDIQSGILRWKVVFKSPQDNIEIEYRFLLSDHADLECVKLLLNDAISKVLDEYNKTIFREQLEGKGKGEPKGIL